MKVTNNKKGIILLSGGLDSVVSLAITKNEYKGIFALIFDYGQKAAKKELEAVNSISEFYRVSYKLITLPWLNEISQSALNKGDDIPIINETELDDKQITQSSAKAVWVANRNALFLNIAASFAESLGYDDIILGANKEEGATFKDNSVEFIQAMNNLLKYSVNNEIKVQAPLIYMTKEEIVKKGIELNIPFELLYSCYNGTNKHCGKCESCLRFKRALKKSNRDDIIVKIFG